MSKPPHDAQVTVEVLCQVALELVARVEAMPFDKTLREAERERGVVRPGAGLEVELATAPKARDGRKRLGLLELDGRVEGVALSQADQRAPDPVARVLGRGYAARWFTLCSRPGDGHREDPRPSGDDVSTGGKEGRDTFPDCIAQAIQ